MKENTVLLKVEKYDHLRDFYKGINDGKFAYVNYRYGNIYYMEETEILESLKREINKLKESLNKYEKPEEKNINQVREMSILQFLKWRNK